jgi:uncharacterized membrane protein YbaN (DUF454 family)
VVVPKRGWRWLWMLAGSSSLLVGFIGIFLPILPTVPFILLAAFCFSRGSEKWEQWILNHHHFGPMVRNWRERRIIPRRAKWFASGMMAISSIASAFVLKMPLAVVPALCCTGVAFWIWSYPSTAREVKSSVEIALPATETDGE